MSVGTVQGTLAERARRVIPGGVSSGQRRVPGIEDLVVVAAAGATFTDDRGRTFVDFHAAFGPPLLGHADPDVDRAAHEAQRALSLVGVGVTPIEIELAERLVAAVPSIEQVLLTSSGSEATFHALRLARAVTGRERIVKFQGCYHGWHDAVALNVITRADRVGETDPLSEGMMAETVQATTVLPFNDAAAVEEALAAGDVAAVILEPVPHNIGCVLPEPEFLERVRAACTRHGTVLVFDEVITGFRHARGGYQELCGVMPDLTTLGKAMANGYPVGAIGGRAELMEEFTTTPGRRAFFAGTYNGHPGCAAAALATLDKLEREPVHEHVGRLGELARTGLRQALADAGQPAFVTGIGSVFVAYLMDGPVRDYRDLLRNDAERFCALRLAQMDDGVFELPLNLKRSHVSYAHTERDIERLVEAAGRAARRLPAVSA